MSSILALAELLKDPDADQDSEEELDLRPSPYATPGAIGPAKTSSTNGTTRGQGAGSKDIWEATEVSEKQQYEYEDPRPQPEYDMVFKQAVTAEDMFLGMGRKNATTACCEDLVVKIKLPGTEFKEVELDITETFLDCRTPKLRLGLHLPHRVDNKQSKAKWLSDQSLLEVTLRLNREYDYVNQ